VMRGGMIRAAQGDVMQSRWGPYGNHPIIVLSASTVPEMFLLTIKAVNLSEKFRVPVILLSDESIGHLRETVETPAVESLEIISRKKPEVPRENFEPLRTGEDLVPAMACIGEGYRVKGYSGLVRNEKGNPTSDPEAKDYLTRRLQKKIDYHLAEIKLIEEMDTEDADVLIYSHGSVVRPALRASALARQMGIKTGVLKASTIWPFPREEIERLSKRVKAIIVPELNLGQIICEVERYARGRIPVIGIQKVDGNLITAQEILSKVEEINK
jgi:2-oxoglutarate ferredoxin oxidoreductase subunit alpha